MKETVGVVRLEVSLTEDEAREYAECLKRIAFGDYRELATSQKNAYLMMMAGEKIKAALGDAGYSPR